ncbi:MAG: FAD synthetase family protein [Clostridiales bacterium]|nr:FAD synthetase family protein [Clostridiales bacterium]
MQIVTDGKAACPRAVIALGMFDGLHIGHQVLIRRARVLAKRANAPLVVCTFIEHPLRLVAPEKCPPLLTTFEERAELLEKMGVDMLFAMPFDETIRQMPPEVYVGELVRRFHPTDVICGYNHTFGKGGSGKPALLSVLGDALGFRTEVVPQVTLEGSEVSSSIIRSELAQGNVEMAGKMLGHPYALKVAIQRMENRLLLQPVDKDKQTVAAGRYRALIRFTGSKKVWPVQVKQGDDGRYAMASLPVPEDEKNCTIELIRQCG